MGTAAINLTIQKGRVGKKKSEVQKLLIGWSKWLAEDSGGVGYSSVGAHLVKTKWVFDPENAWESTATLDDEMALKVDYAVARLRLKCGEGDHRFDVIVRSYLLNESDSEAGRALKIHRNTALAARHAAENWIDAYLDATIDIPIAQQITSNFL